MNLPFVRMSTYKNEVRRSMDAVTQITKETWKLKEEVKELKKALEDTRKMNAGLREVQENNRKARANDLSELSNIRTALDTTTRMANNRAKTLEKIRRLADGELL